MNVTLRSNNIWKELVSYLFNFRYTVRFDKPCLTLRIIQDYLRLLALRRTPLRYVDIATDYGCNLNCAHCSAQKLKRPPGTRQMDVSDFERLAQQCLDLGVIIVGFTGGEPLIYPDLEQAIKAFKPNRTMVSIKTNGTLLDEEWLKRLSDWQVDSISIGLGPVTDNVGEYDRLRGLTDSYAKSLHAAERAKEYGFRVIIGVVVSHENIRSKNVIRILELTADMGMILTFGLAVPAGSWIDQKDDILLTEEDRIYLRKLLLKYRHARTDFESNFKTRGCGAMNEKLYITPYGDVIPCPFVQISFGNIFDDSLKVIRERGLSYPVFQGYPDRCLAADHYEFINECLCHTFDMEQLPVDHKDIPGMRMFDENGRHQ